jgi:hypothetical protein
MLAVTNYTCIATRRKAEEGAGGDLTTLRHEAQMYGEYVAPVDEKRPNAHESHLREQVRCTLMMRRTKRTNERKLVRTDTCRRQSGLAAAATVRSAGSAWPNSLVHNTQGKLRACCWKETVSWVQAIAHRDTQLLCQCIAMAQVSTATCPATIKKHFARVQAEHVPSYLKI